MIDQSIVEVFGEKSQDGDKAKGLLLNALIGNSYENGGQVIKPREIRRRESEYPRSEYGVLEPEEIKVFEELLSTSKERKKLHDLYMERPSGRYKKAFETGESVEGLSAAEGEILHKSSIMDDARAKFGAGSEKYFTVYNALKNLKNWGTPSRDKHGGFTGFYDDPEGKSKGNIISPLELNELLIEGDIAMEKPGYPTRQQPPPKMQAEGKGLMSLLQRLIPGGKTGYK